MGILAREFEKRSRHLPIRTLLQQAGHAIQRIKPVFMMSPFSVASYLPKDGMRFDYVVFDEASQMRPVEALGAIVRGEQSIVVGDSRQLPPSAFFEAVPDPADEEDESPTSDLESILGMFNARGAPDAPNLRTSPSTGRTACPTSRPRCRLLRVAASSRS